jgi:hypothetical protein
MRMRGEKEDEKGRGNSGEGIKKGRISISLKKQRRYEKEDGRIEDYRKIEDI